MVRCREADLDHALALVSGEFNCVRQEVDEDLDDSALIHENCMDRHFMERLFNGK